MSQERQTYHHGNLRTALVEAGLELTRAGGPDGLALREVTRRVNVSPTAAYRHFADRHALLAEVAARVQDAMAERMQAQQMQAQHRREAGPHGALRAVGLGYIDFAVTEPGWFEVAFFGPQQPSGPRAVTPPIAPTRVPPPFALLMAALDELVTAGVLSPADRIGAEWPCWSAVHGFAELVVHGPLRDQPPELVQELAERTVDVAVAGVLSRR